jgi:hypothetical protein
MCTVSVERIVVPMSVCFGHFDIQVNIMLHQDVLYK